MKPILLVGDGYMNSSQMFPGLVLQFHFSQIMSELKEAKIKVGLVPATPIANLPHGGVPNRDNEYRNLLRLPRDVHASSQELRICFYDWVVDRHGSPIENLSFQTIEFAERPPQLG
jgi:hypothetical protein